MYGNVRGLKSKLIDFKMSKFETEPDIVAFEETN